MSHPTVSPGRRGVLLGLAALPAAGGIAAAAMLPDPHADRLPEALALWRHHQTTAWGWSEPSDSSASDAADVAHGAVMDHAVDGLRLPVPATVASLGAFALSLALAHEGHFRGTEDDLSERCFAGLLAAVLHVTGAALPEGFGSLFYQGDADTAAARAVEAR